MGIEINNKINILHNHGIETKVENGIAYAIDEWIRDGVLSIEWVKIDSLNLVKFLNY